MAAATKEPLDSVATDALRCAIETWKELTAQNRAVLNRATSLAQVAGIFGSACLALSLWMLRSGSMDLAGRATALVLACAGIEFAIGTVVCLRAYRTDDGAVPPKLGQRIDEFMTQSEASGASFDAEVTANLRGSCSALEQRIRRGERCVRSAAQWATSGAILAAFALAMAAVLSLADVPLAGRPGGS